MLGTRYNKVVKLNGLFGVSTGSICLKRRRIIIVNIVTPQRRILYVFDPVALQQILIKDMDSYDAPEWFLE